MTAAPALAQNSDMPMPDTNLKARLRISFWLAAAWIGGGCLFALVFILLSLFANDDKAALLRYYALIPFGFGCLVGGGYAIGMLFITRQR
jgi:hypothetical protein